MKTPSILAVLFDFDGVLTTDKTGSLTTTRYLSERTGIALPRVQSAFRRFNEDLTLGRTTHAEVWERICAELGRELSFDLLDAAFESTPMSEPMLRLAGDLKASYRVGIVTDNKKDRIDCLKNLHGLPATFDPIVVSAEVGSGKDHPAIFAAALERMEVRAGECVFIDNSRANLVAPSSLGMKTLHFDDEKQDFEALLDGLRAHGVRVAPGPP